MMPRIVTWILLVLIFLALIAVLVIVIGLLSDQTGEASPLHAHSIIEAIRAF
jgi:hypothetical protein